MKKDWELNRLKALKEEEERKAEMDEDELMYTYSKIEVNSIKKNQKLVHSTTTTVTNTNTMANSNSLIDSELAKHKKRSKSETVNRRRGGHLSLDNIVKNGDEDLEESVIVTKNDVGLARGMNGGRGRGRGRGRGTSTRVIDTVSYSDGTDDKETIRAATIDDDNSDYCAGTDTAIADVVAAISLANTANRKLNAVNKLIVEGAKKKTKAKTTKKPKSSKSDESLSQAEQDSILQDLLLDESPDTSPKLASGMIQPKRSTKKSTGNSTQTTAIVMNSNENIYKKPFFSYKKQQQQQQQQNEKSQQSATISSTTTNNINNIWIVNSPLETQVKTNTTILNKILTNQQTSQSNLKLPKETTATTTIVNHNIITNNTNNYIINNSNNYTIIAAPKNLFVPANPGDKLNKTPTKVIPTPTIDISDLLNLQHFTAPSNSQPQTAKITVINKTPTGSFTGPLQQQQQQRPIIKQITKIQNKKQQ